MGLIYESTFPAWVPTCVELFADPVSAAAAVDRAALEAARAGGGIEGGPRVVLLAVPGFLQLVDLLLRADDDSMRCVVY